MLPENILNWHPIFVHFTIALFSIATMLIVSSLFIKNDFKSKLPETGYINLWLGCLFTFVTVATGFYAYNTVAHDEPSHAAMTDHRNWAFVTASIFLVLTLWSIKLYRDNKKQNLLFIGFLVLATSLLSITGWKGTEAVYRYGLGVMSLPNTDSHQHPGGGAMPADHMQTMPEKAVDMKSNSDMESNHHSRNESLHYHTIVNNSFDSMMQSHPQFPWESFTAALQSSKLNSKESAIEISLLKGGFSSDALFKINLSGNNYVLRFIGDNHSLKQRKIISSSFEWAGLNSFGPKNYLIDQYHFSFILLEFAEGRTLNIEDTKNKKTLKAIGVILSKVHKAKFPKQNYQEFSQFTFGQKWYHTTAAEKNKIIGPSVLKEAYKHWVKINDEVNKLPIKKSMLHNDPNLRNVLLNGEKITLLDWELSGVGDPRKEVAHVCAWYGLNDELINAFLTGYYDRAPTNKELQILKKLKTQILLEFAWVGLSTLKTDLDQQTWDKYYDQASPKTIEDLSLIQMQSENKPTDEVTRDIFLGLIKQFTIENKKE
ncbi:MAG: phosphotransferase [Alphaproteobacteria bacterium]|nr:phosphotransferase [Alphaproteobacteria bacterium]